MSGVRFIIEPEGVRVFATSKEEPVEMALYFYEPTSDVLTVDPGWTEEEALTVDDPRLLAACRSAYEQAKANVKIIVDKQRQLERFMTPRDGEEN